MTESMIDAQHIIQENERRKANLTKPYDPFVGTEYCTEIRRAELYIPDSPLMPRQYVPVEMMSERIVQLVLQMGLHKLAGGLFGGAITDDKVLKAFDILDHTRCKYDFEYFCARCINITYKGGGAGAFVLNPPQRKLLRTFERLRKAGEPINVILLKARQWGGSTMTQFYMAWIQLFWKDNWNSVICADVEDQAKNVLNMLDRAFESYPLELTGGQTMVLKRHAQSSSIRRISSRHCTIAVGSMVKPNKSRSQDISMAHLTEVGLWEATQKRKPEDLVQSIFGSVQEKPYTMKVMESTAKGVGNYFHTQWLKANATGTEHNGFTPVFVAWYEIPMYQEPVYDYEEFISSLNDKEWLLWRLGATLEGIKWHRRKKLTMNDDFRLAAEFPTTADEAFQSTGHNYYPIEDVERMRLDNEEPRMIGEIVGDAQGGKDCLKNVRLQEVSNGCLKIWRDRNEYSDKPMRDRYVVVLDIGGFTYKSDPACICVFDRYWMHELNGIPEVVAEWHGHATHSLQAWKAAQIATYYNNALLVIESNSLDMDKGKTEGGNADVILDELGDSYKNLYRRAPTKQDIGRGILIGKYGFITSAQTKPVICDFLKTTVHEGGYIERCREAVDEFKTFEVDSKGGLNAVEGQHDDRHITRAIGIRICYKELPLPCFEENASKQVALKKVTNDLI